MTNPVYTGAIVSQTKLYRFKIGTIGDKRPEDWIVVEGQHEALIDRGSNKFFTSRCRTAYTYCTLYGGLKSERWKRVKQTRRDRYKS